MDLEMGDAKECSPKEHDDTKRDEALVLKRYEY